MKTEGGSHWSVNQVVRINTALQKKRVKNRHKNYKKKKKPVFCGHLVYGQTARGASGSSADIATEHTAINNFTVALDHCE